MDESLTQQEEKEFEERSDYIFNDDLVSWDVKNSHFEFIQNKIISKGAKLLVGPRGTGKTHQMRVVYTYCTTNSALPLPVYVSFNKYFCLEPLLSKSPNALRIFHTWVLCKILLACYECIDSLRGQYDIITNQDKNFERGFLIDFISEAEKGYTRPSSDILITTVTPSKVTSVIEDMTLKLGRRRAILMLDDAALTLTPDYMVEFFDIFRSLKTSIVSPKASVYPGTTEYGPRFHVNQDAEKVECWMSVEDAAYSKFMDSLIEKRFPQVKTVINEDVLELLKYASFGVPRAFIVLVRAYTQEKGNTTQGKFNHLIEEQARLIKAEYLSLQQKMPQYYTVIEIGFQFFEKIIALMKDENKGLQNEKQILIGIQSVENNMLERMNRFLVEAGLMYDKGAVSHGEDRGYQRYIPHFLFLISNKTFSDNSRGFNVKYILDKINSKPKKHPLRRNYESILSANLLQKLKLDLPVCKHCKTPRLAENQRFCHNCGNQLVNQSAFEQCLKISIDELPLTHFQKQKVKERSFKTIGDFMTKIDAATELQKAHQIGKKRSYSIISKVEGIVEEFLA